MKTIARAKRNPVIVHSTTNSLTAPKTVKTFLFQIGSNVKEGSEKESAMLMTADVLPTCYEIGERDR